jgi:hypothetical protein
VESPSARRIASPWHTAGVLFELAAWAAWSKFHSDQLRAAVNPPRLPLYGLTFLFEGLLLAFVVWGASPLAVLGPRWKSARDLLRDIGVAAAFWVVSGILLAGLSWALRATGLWANTRFMLPRTPLESVLWIALSIAAGICEEAVFRGYPQSQFAAFTGRASAGILLSAAAFGACHAYQGLRQMMLIACYGAMFGLLAHQAGPLGIELPPGDQVLHRQRVVAAARANLAVQPVGFLHFLHV